MLQLPDILLKRVRFVTYGSQLRAWFGRFFPDLLGPAVLGHEVTARPEFGSAWPDAPQQPRRDGFTPPVGSLTSRLQSSQHWQNLYRRTDPLGFKVFQDSENDIDQHLSEWDPQLLSSKPDWTGRRMVKPLGHSQYQESDVYRDLIRSWLDHTISKQGEEEENRKNSRAGTKAPWLRAQTLGGSFFCSTRF